MNTVLNILNILYHIQHTKEDYCLSLAVFMKLIILNLSTTSLHSTCTRIIEYETLLYARNPVGSILCMRGTPWEASSVWRGTPWEASANDPSSFPTRRPSLLEVNINRLIEDLFLVKINVIKMFVWKSGTPSVNFGSVGGFGSISSILNCKY